MFDTSDVIEEKETWESIVCPGQLFWNYTLDYDPKLAVQYKHEKMIMVVSRSKIKNDLSTYARNLLGATYPFYWIVEFIAGEKTYREHFYTFTQWQRRFKLIKLPCQKDH